MIRAASKDPAVRAVAALRLVQQKIRYVGVEISAGRYFARLPEEVVARGFGDCKDKALLLKTLLQDLGLKAGVALANADTGKHLDVGLPTAGRFNHMIAWVEIGGQIHWMDPTDDFQGGTLATAVTPDYGYVLRVGNAAPGRLEQIVQPVSQAYAMMINETHRFGADGDRIEVLTRYFGDAADRARAYWANTAARDIRRRYRDYYDGYYPGVKVVRPARTRDLPEANIFEIRESYLVPQDTVRSPDLQKDYPFVGPELDDSFPKRIASDRSAPLWVRYPRSVLHRVEIHNAPIDFSAPDPVTIETPAFRFQVSGTDAPGGYMSIVWSYSALAPWVAPEQAAEVVREARKMAHDLVYTWDLTP